MHLPEVLTVLLVLSFGLEGLTSGLLSVLRLIPAIRPLCEQNSSDKVAADGYRAAHTLLAASIAIGFCYTADLGIFQPLLNKISGAPVPNLHKYLNLDPLITALVLAAGSERLTALRKKVGDSPPAVNEEAATETDAKKGDVIARATFGEAPSKKVELTLSRDAEAVVEGRIAAGTGD